MAAPIPRILSWPLGSVDADGRLRWALDDASVREVMLNILLTRPGERLQRPQFGAGLLHFIHQPNNETTRHLIASQTLKALQQWEPRVEVDEVEVHPSPDNLAEVHITIRYRMRHTQTPAELGFSFNLGVPA